MAVASGFGTPTSTVHQVVEHGAETFRALFAAYTGRRWRCPSVRRPS